MNKTLILNKIISAYGFKNDSDFANHLGVNPQVVYNWKKRNTFNQSLLIEKLPNLNKLFLLTGEGIVKNLPKADTFTQEFIPTDYEAILQEKERIIAEQANHINTLKQSLNMNEKVIDVMSETLKRTISGEQILCKSQDVG